MASAGGVMVSMVMGEANASPEGGERWAVNTRFGFFNLGGGSYLQGKWFENCIRGRVDQNVCGVIIPGDVL